PLQQMLRLCHCLASKYLAAGRFDGPAYDTRISHSQSPRDAEECAARADAGRPAVDTAARVEQLAGSSGRVRCFAFGGIELVDVEAAPRCGELFGNARGGCGIVAGGQTCSARELQA